MQLPEETTFEQWMVVGRGLGRVQRSVSWCAGDWWRFKERYGDRVEAVQSEDWSGPSYKTCRNAAVTCQVFSDLTFSHHTEVASIKDETLRESFLDWCQEPLKSGSSKPRTVQALREELERRGLRSAKSPAVADSAEDIADSAEELLDTEIEDEGEEDEMDQPSRSVSYRIDLGTSEINLSPPSLDDLRDQYIQGMRTLIDKESRPEERAVFIRILLEKEWTQIRRSIEEDRDASASPEPSPRHEPNYVQP